MGEHDSGYVGAIMLLIVTVIISYILFIAVLPIADQVTMSFTKILVDSDNFFFTAALQDRLEGALSAGWAMPFAFITVSIVYIVLKTIKRQRYTEYSNDY